ncbi:MAG: class I SAM-dependent methyltransferase [Solirubrobacteraceae bacterium]
MSEDTQVGRDGGASEDAAVGRDGDASEDAAVGRDGDASEEAAVGRDGGASEEDVFDAERHRRESLEQWEGAAPGWARWQELMREFSTPVSRWLVDSLQLDGSETVLDIAAGIGETGFLAAQRLDCGGNVIIGDHAEGMIVASRARAQELGLSNVTFEQLNAEWLDLATASVDAILCRWGVMLMADCATALRELRRVLRPGGRIALAVWAAPERNPWVTIPMRVVLAHTAGATRAGADAPGMFALADPQRLRTTVLDAGFSEVVVSSVALVRRHESFEQLWECTLDTSANIHDLVMGCDAAQIAQIEADLRGRLMPYEDVEGALSVPGETLVVRAQA